MTRGRRATACWSIARLLSAHVGAKARKQEGHGTRGSEKGKLLNSSKGSCNSISTWEHEPAWRKAGTLLLPCQAWEAQARLA